MDIGRIAVLGAICVVAYLAGEVLAKRHVPRLPVYLAVGALAGLAISHARDAADVAFPGVSSVALGVIGFVAGSHLVWPAIRRQARAIGLQVVGMSVAVPLFASGIVAFVLRDQETSVTVAAALLTGTIMLALSPPEAIAVISESRAAGPFTRLVLGATVVMDVVVVVGFSVALTAANALLGDDASLGSLVAGVTVGLLLSVAAGLVVGAFLIFVVRRAGSFRSAALLIVAASAASVWLAVVAVHWAESRLDVHAEVESLLVAMIAGVLVANTAAEGPFAELLERLAPPVYVVFFTLTGLGLHLDALLAAAVPAALLWVVRGAGLWVGSRTAMTVAGESDQVRKVAWKAFVPQAGIALALAATVAETYPRFGDTLATVVIGTVVLNEAIGPFFLRSALESVGETAPTEELLH
ncbi:cation:proton antiporter [Nocardioides sp. LHG3406-4]|uniref:cation:proton antiporter n=1 Tax=Nocardioides sp. LHG3406-4 TaxID=2804575 RepID=UPI003CEDACFA